MLENCLSENKQSTKNKTRPLKGKSINNVNSLKQWKDLEQKDLPKLLAKLAKSRAVSEPTTLKRNIKSFSQKKLDIPSLREVSDMYWPIKKEERIPSTVPIRVFTPPKFNLTKAVDIQRGSAEDEEENEEDIDEGESDNQVDINQVEDYDQDVTMASEKSFSPIATRTRTQEMFKEMMKAKAYPKRKFSAVEYGKTGVTPKIKSSKISKDYESWKPYEKLYK